MGTLFGTMLYAVFYVPLFLFVLLPTLTGMFLTSWLVSAGLLSLFGARPPKVVLRATAVWNLISKIGSAPICVYVGLVIGSLTSQTDAHAYVEFDVFHASSAFHWVELAVMLLGPFFLAALLTEPWLAHRQFKGKIRCAVWASVLIGNIASSAVGALMLVSGIGVR